MIATREAITPSVATSCRVCEYDLRGSPPGRCPECGTPFDHSLIVLYGEAPRSEPAVRSLILIAGLLGIVFVQRWWPSFSVVVASIGVIALVIDVAGMIRRRRARRRFGTDGGSTQVALGPDGVTIRRGPGPADPIPWSRVRRYRMQRPHRSTRDSTRLTIWMRERGGPLVLDFGASPEETERIQTRVDAWFRA